MAFQSQTYANSNSAYYGNPADWSNYSTINDTIRFNDTDATLTVIPAVPDSNTTITFNGNQLAYVADVPDLANWAQYPANHDVDIPDLYKLNAGNASISSLGASTIVANDIQTPQANFSSTIIAPNLTVSTLTGLSVNVVADQGIFTTTPSAIDLTTTNGSYGKISLTANPGQLNTLGGQVNMTANGGNSVGGLFGQVNIIANPGTETGSNITTGGKVFIQANSGSALANATAAITLSAGGINSYAGYATPLASLAGYNFINGTAGVSIVASVVPNSAWQVPGTCYLYGDTGITLGSDTYVTRIFPYWNGLTAPPNLQISGRNTISGNAFVVLSNVSSINGIAYPPPPASAGVATLNTLNGNLNLTSVDNSVTITSSIINGTIDLAATGGYNPNLVLSTLTMEPNTGVIRTNSIQNLNTNANDFGISQENATGNISLSVSPGSGPTIGLIKIRNDGEVSFNELAAGSGVLVNPSGNTLTFNQDITPADQGQIVGLSTINGQPLSAFGAYDPNPLFSTITMISYNGLTLEGVISTDDLRALPNQPLTIRGGFSGADNSLINMGVSGAISFNNTNAGGVTNGAGLEISAEGQNLTFPLDPAGLLPVGQILNLSTINGQALSAFGGYTPNLLLSTLTMEPNLGVIRTNSIQNPNTNANDFGISQENATGNLTLNVSPSAGPTIGKITIQNDGVVSFNELAPGSGILINSSGNTLTFLQDATPADQGQIVGLSTINGVAFSSSGVASLNALTGALSLTATEGTVVITPSSPNINLYVPSAPYTLSGTTAGAVITNRAIGSGNPFPSNTFTQVTEITFNIPPGWAATDSVSYDGYAFFDFSANFNSFWGVNYITNTFATPTDILGSTTNTANALNYPNNQQIYLPLNLIVPPTYLSAGGTITFRIFCSPTSTNHYIVSTPVNTAKISIVRD